MAEKFRVTKKMLQLVEVILKNGTEEQKKPILDAIESYKVSIVERKRELKRTINKAKRELDALSGKVSDTDETTDESVDAKNQQQSENKE